MLAPTQHRYFWFYLLLPLVVVSVLAAAAQLIALQRAEMIAELTDRIEHRDSHEAAAAVRELAKIPKPPLAVLVAAANSADQEVAAEAKLAISRLLRRAQRQIETQQRVKGMALQLTQLAAALEAQQAAFAAADYPWLSSTTRKVLRLANQIPPRHAPLVAAHCDAVLAAIAARESENREMVENGSEIDEPFVDEEARIHEPRQPLQAGFQSAVSEASAMPTSADARPPMHVSGRVSQEPAAEESARELIESPWRATWSHPIFRIVPAQPITPLPEDEPAPAATPDSPAPETPSDEEAKESPLASVDSRQLLQRWVRAEGSAVLPLEQELTRRGFGRLSGRLVEQLFSPRTEDRWALANNVLSEPGVNARPWLVLLSEDSHADVRLLAVTIMATSHEPALLEHAWQVVIRDRDPRIAGLAGRLRERQAGTLRR